MKKCPYCAEQIQDEAIFCRYCRRDIEPEIPPEHRKKCPFCAEWIHEESILCRYCGREFGVIPSQVSAIPSQVGKTIIGLQSENRDDRYKALKIARNEEMTHPLILEVLEIISKNDTDSDVAIFASNTLRILRKKGRKQRTHCPYCKTLINTDSLSCPSCGRALADPTSFQKSGPYPSVIKSTKPTTSVMKSTPPIPKPKKDDPPVIMSLLFMILLLVILYGSAFMLGYFFEYDYDLLLGVQGITRIFVAYLGLKGWKPNEDTFLRFLGVLLLSLIPLVSWVVLYWAGKYIARSLTKR